MRLGVAVMLAVCVLASVAQAVELVSSVIDNGGGPMASSGGLFMWTSVGQPIVGGSGGDEGGYFAGWIWSGGGGFPSVEEAEDGLSIPQKFEVIALYPNPFSDFVIIKFTMPKGGEVQLMVFDVAGRLVYRETCRLESEVHTLKWQNPLTPSGVYFYQLKTDDGNTIKGKLVKIN